MRRIEKFREENYFLSNFYPAEVLFEEIRYPSSEAAYQACKCPDDKEREAFAALSAKEAKIFGESMPIRDDWEEIKLSVMERVVRAKFTQNPDLAKLLIETEDAELIEGNDWGDTFWGADIETGIGENHLGKILMNLREELTGGKTEMSFGMDEK